MSAKQKVSKDGDKPSTKSRSVAMPTTSKDTAPGASDDEHQRGPSWMSRCCKYLYDKETNMFCERTCKSWWAIIIYSLMYLIFLSTFTMLILYVTLIFIKSTETYNIIDKSELMAYTANGIGLTAVPTSLHSSPIIAYTHGNSEEYSKYVKSLDELIVNRRKKEVSDLTELGPCGTPPYGYGDKPCLIIRLNKQFNWTPKPIRSASSDIPNEMRSWLSLKEKKLWLHCAGYYPYDKEHIGKIDYYPYPPGFDPGVFPLDAKKEAPLIGVQISNFTIGLSLAVECKLWYESGVSSVSFLLYVEPKNRTVRNEKVLD